MAGAVQRAPARVRLVPHLLLGAFCAGLAVAARLPAPAGAAAVGAILLAVLGAAGAAALLAGHARAAVGALALVALCSGWHLGLARMAATAPVALELPVDVVGTAVVQTPPVPDPNGGWRMRAGAEGLATAVGTPLPRGARILLTLRRGAAPPVGARLRVAGRLRPAAARDAPGWWRAWLARQGIAARLTPRSALPAGRRGGLAGVRDRWRGWATANVAAGLEGDIGAIVRGMALGGGALLSPAAADAFRDAGVWHLLAVSGQNVAVVALAALALLVALGVPRRPALVAAGTVLVAYCLACDGGASVARAGIVGGLALVGELRGAPRDRWALLLAGLALLAAWNPRSLGDPGLQLSFAAVAGIFTLAPVLGRWLRGWLPKPVALTAGVSAAAGLATAPVLAAHFGELSLVGFAVNVVAVPLAAPVVVLALTGIGLGALVPAAGAAAAWSAGLGAAVLLAVSRAAAAVPAATVAVGGGAVVPLAALAAAPPLIARWLAAVPGTGPSARRLAAAGLVVAVVLAGAWAFWPRPAPAPWPAAPALTALDVGQGDAILMRSPDGAAVLIDAGPPGDPPAVAAALRRHGVRRLDALVITHGDADHAGGAPAVLDRVRVAAVVHPPEPADGWGEAMRAALDAAARAGTPAAPVTAGASLAAGAWRLRVMAPRGPLPAGAEANAGSVVIRADAPGLSALLTGDAESPVLAGLATGPVDVLKVAHHGSADPGLAPLLARLRPAAAVISVGAGNPFGHPRPEVVAALAGAGARVWRTDRDGDVTLPAATP